MESRKENHVENTNEREATIQTMDVRIKPEDSMNVTSLVSFYDNVAETMGLDKDAVRYDCTKIDVARNIQDSIFKSWEKLGASDFDIGMTWCNSGPKTDDKLPRDTIRIDHGFLRNENGEPLPFDDLIKSNTERQKQRHYIEGIGFAVRVELKEIGCRFDPDKKQWYHADPEKASEAQRLIDNQDGGHEQKIKSPDDPADSPKHGEVSHIVTEIDRGM